MKSLSLSQPHVIIMVGVSGSGKTFFAEKFADTFSTPYVSREKIAAIIADATASSIDDLFYYQLGELLKSRQSIIIEGGGDTRASRSETARIARTHGYKTLFIWVQTDPLTAKARALKEKTLTPEEYDQQAKRFTPPIALEKPIVISGKHTYATQAKIILKKLSEPRAEISAHTAAPIRTENPRRHNITIR
jgi:predicted kinase